MDTLSALPGVVLMKAQGFPRTQFNLALEFAGRDRSPEEVAAWHVELLSQYFAMGLGSDNLWTTVAEQMWSHTTAAIGQYAVALDQVVLKLLASPTKTPSGFFSIYSTFHVANTTAVSPYTLMYGSDPDGWTPSQFETREEEIRYGVRPSLWRHMESNGLSGLPSTHGVRRDLELMLLKSSLIAIGLLSANDWEQIASWLSDFRHKFAGQNYTYDDLIVSAEEHNIAIHPFLTDWLHETRLPAFVTSPVTVVRISDDEQGNPRYQSSITVRNVGSVPGFIRVRYGGEGRSNGIHIEADSAKTVTVTTSSMWDSLFVMPHLSLNHLPFSVASNSGSVHEQPSAESVPVEQQSDWTPKEEGDCGRRFRSWIYHISAFARRNAVCEHWPLRLVLENIDWKSNWRVEYPPGDRDSTLRQPLQVCGIVDLTPVHTASFGALPPRYGSEIQNPFILLDLKPISPKQPCGGWSITCLRHGTDDKTLQVTNW